MPKQREDPVSFVKEKCEEATNWTVLRQIQINRAFYSGYQWISWDPVQKRVYVPELRPGEKRYTYNKIKPAILTLLAKLTKNRVKLEVKPDTNDIDRIETAKAALKFLKYQWDVDDMDAKSQRLKFYMLVDGFPALKVYVDKTQGEDIALPDDLTEDVERVPAKTGKIVTRVVDQFALKIDPSAECIEDIRWVIEESPMDVDEIEDIWGVRVEPEDTLSIRNTFDWSLATSTQPTKKYTNMAMVYDYWELPNSKYPNGRRIVVAGDKVLENSTNPGEFPYIFFPAIPLPGTAIATGVVTDMTTPQRSYNIKRTAEARVLEEMGNPIWKVPTGSVDDDEIVNEIGGIIHFTPISGSEPKREQGVEPGVGWQNAMERDEADMEDISGAHEISQGAAPKGNNTFSGLALQVEQDETKLHLLVNSYENGIKKWAEKVLRLVQKHFPEEQQLSIVGENGQIEAFTFSGSDLSGKEVVDVIPGSSMPALKAVQDQKIMEMWGAGLFNDPRTGLPDVRRVVRMLGESIAAEYFDDTEQDENKALMENRAWQQAFSDTATVQALREYYQNLQRYQNALAQGEDPAQLGPPPQMPVQFRPVREFDDHETHIRAHNRYRKTDEYDQLPPELQAIVDQHVAQHEQYLMQPIVEQQQEQMAMQQAQVQEAEIARQREREEREEEHIRDMEREALRGAIALRQAALKGGARGAS